MALKDMKEGDFFRYEGTITGLYIWHGLGDHQAGEGLLLWPEDRLGGPLFRGFSRPDTATKVNLCKSCLDLAGREKGQPCPCWLECRRN